MSPLTIVVPSLNERENIGKLLVSIYRQEGVSPFEIILADAGSTDGTPQEACRIARALDMRLRTVSGGLPAKGRNMGANAATTPYIVFIDADIELTNPYTLRDALKHLEDGKDLVACGLRTYERSFQGDVFHALCTALIHLSRLYIRPHAMGAFMAMNLYTFRKLGGFDEGIKYGEDYMLARRIRQSKFSVLRTRVTTSCRRLRKTGLMKVIGMSVKTFLFSNNREVACRDVDYWN